ncbi:uncharacterized protein B0I36DRAFT_56841 [Microdochium trichocladiopsis]|uniref:Uncharacterized protein n=1 Tax=Microdochium trichocladiopsis TaxID=1682393 RepID=A0A9P9BIB8_9PEZI|nr:uncharacterized protein B0I36DRAFT_56841 [Microdochium trichocladiopsis]KAH7010878.1 hypothetical protein B0I36DRAFT_56841 [Microdochium trichocladiopsis]
MNIVRLRCLPVCLLGRRSLCARRDNSAHFANTAPNFYAFPTFPARVFGGESLWSWPSPQNHGPTPLSITVDHFAL